MRRTDAPFRLCFSSSFIYLFFNHACDQSEENIIWSSAKVENAGLFSLPDLLGNVCVDDAPASVSLRAGKCLPNVLEALKVHVSRVYRGF